MSERQTIEHIHKQQSDEEYNKEVIIGGINRSVYLKSNQNSDTLMSMTDLAIDTMRKIKELEEKS